MTRRVYEVGGLCVALLLALFAVSGAVAQETEQAEPAFRGHYVMMHQVDPLHMVEYQALMAKYVAAEKQHENGNTFATYSTMTGGPKTSFYYLFPFQEIGDLGGWSGPVQIMGDTYGAEETREWFRKYNAITGGPSNWLSMQASDVSNLDPEAIGTYKNFGYYIHAKVEAGHGAEYRAALAKIVAAHKDHPRGLHWGTGIWTIGRSGGGPEYGIVIGFDKFAELDEWPMGPELLIEKFGEEEAAAIMKAMPEHSDAEMHFVALVPELSVLPGGE